MTSQDNNSMQTTPVPTIWQEILLNYRPLILAILVFLGLIILTLTIITVSAYLQGSRVSILGVIEIEAQPTNQALLLADPPTPTSQSIDTNKVAIEDFQGEVYSYSSRDVFAYGELKVIRNPDGDLDYRLYYEVLPDADSWAGIFFYFSPTQDLTQFKNLQVTINFSDEQARCGIFLQDLHDRKSFIILGNNRFDNASDDAQMVIQGNNRIFTIPLASNFLQDVDSNPLNKQSISGVGFGMDGSEISGEYNCTIQEVSFLR